MHRKPELELVPLDTLLERTLRNLKKVRFAKEMVMAKQREIPQHILAEEVNRPLGQRTMKDFWKPVIRDDYSTIRQPSIEVNNFELKPALIPMVQQNQFIGYPSEDPNEHMGRFLRMANTVKLNGVRPDVIKLQLFPFSIRDTEARSFESLPYGSVNTWDELVEAFMGRFFHLALTLERRGEIIIFKQGEDESLYNAWERYKKLLKRCSMHGIDHITHMDILYQAMNYTSKRIIDAAYCGAF